MTTTPETWKIYEKANPIRVARQLLDPHPITVCTAAKHGFALASSMSDDSGEDRWFGMAVSPSRMDLALRIIDALVKACEARGFDLRHDHDHGEYGSVSVFIEGEPTILFICEQGDFSPHLSLEARKGFSHHGKLRTWNDCPSRRLANRLNSVMLYLRTETSRRLDAAEEERQLEALHRERDALRGRVEQEQKRVEKFHSDAADWQRAQIMRDYIAEVEAQPATGKQRKARRAWASWAHEQADRLDPLRDSPPSVLDTPRRLYRKLTDYEILCPDGSIEI